MATRHKDIATGIIAMKMDKIEYIHGGIELLDLVGPLWEDLNRHHAQVSAHHFADHFRGLAFPARKASFLTRHDTVRSRGTGQGAGFGFLRGILCQHDLGSRHR